VYQVEGTSLLSIILLLAWPMMIKIFRRTVMFDESKLLRSHGWVEWRAQRFKPLTPFFSASSSVPEQPGTPASTFDMHIIAQGSSASTVCSSHQTWHGGSSLVVFQLVPGVGSLRLLVSDEHCRVHTVRTIDVVVCKPCPFPPRSVGRQCLPCAFY